MKIKETLSSVRELETQLRKFGGASNGGATVKSAASPAGDAAKVEANLSSDLNSRSDRVQQLKNLVDSGQYRTDSTEIAKSVIRDLF